MINVLITSASRKVSLVQAFVEAARLEGGGKVIAADADWRSAALHFAGRSYLVPKSLDARFFDAIHRICERESVRLVIPTRDKELPAFSQVRGEFLARGIVVMVADPEVVAVCQDKLRFVSFCCDRGFHVPRTFGLTDLDTAPFPLFVKERFGKGSANARRIASREGLELTLPLMGHPVIQECVEAQEYTVDLMADFCSRVLTAVARERLRVLGGESFVGRTSRQMTVIDECVRLADALKLVGHNTIQCFFDGRTVKFIEVNPRFGGGANLGFAAGICTPRYLLQLVQKKPVEPRIGEFEDGLVMLRYTQDVFLHSGEVGTIGPCD